MRGGKRPGAGRKPGSKSRRTKEREEAFAAQSEKIEKALGDLGAEPFKGDAHELMMATYKDTSLHLGIRLDAAKAAAPYEKPKLQAIEHSGNVGNKTQEDWLDELDDDEPRPQVKPKPRRKR